PADPSNPAAGEKSSSLESFTIDGGCLGGFAPSFSAGTVTPAAGGSSPFITLFSRSDQDQHFAGIELRPPPGLLAKIAGIPLCREPQAAAETCPAASKIGHVTVAAGAGPNPVSLPEPGRAQDPVYLTGSYRGAPFGLSVVVPVQAGPFDLGTVVVRAAVYVDAHTARVTVVSDALPQILQGRPLKLRELDVTLDR